MIGGLIVMIGEKTAAYNRDLHRLKIVNAAVLYSINMTTRVK